MKKTIAVISAALVIVVSVGAALLLNLKVLSLDFQLKEAKYLAKNLEEETARIQAEREKIARENEKFQEESVFYLSVNSKLKDEKDKLASQLGRAQGASESQAADLQRLSKKLEESQGALAKKEKEFQEEGVAKVKELESKVKVLEKALNKERAVFLYNLAVAYVKAGLYDEAVDAYEKSLKIDKNNADAHYNLGLLYRDTKQDSGKAAVHLRRYLELRPDAEDKGVVKEWLEKLK